MRKCWNHCPEDRPSFRMLKEQLLSVSQGLLADWLSLLHCTLSSSTVSPKSPNPSRCNPPCPPAPTSPIRASTSPETCIFCASYSSGHPWIEICRAIQATRHKWGHPHLHVNYCFKLFKSAWTCMSAALRCEMCMYVSSCIWMCVRYPMVATNYKPCLCFWFYVQKLSECF